MTATKYEGHVAEGFGPVADAFVDNFEQRGDTGAACAVYVGGELLVDLWAGTTNRTGGTEHPDGSDSASFTHDTRSVLFSASKGITTICLLMAAEAGHLELDNPVAQYWPEFAANGKDTITVRQVLAHQAGLIAPTEPLSVQQVHDWTPVTQALEKQAPLWTPGTAYAYHAMTVGWLAGEVLRRASGSRPSQWLREKITEPLGLHATFGARPDDPDLALIGEPLPTGPGALPVIDTVDAAMLDRVMGLGAFDGLDLFNAVNRAEWLEPEIPAGNLVTTAHDLAKLYAATVGEVDGVRLLQPGTVRDARIPLSVGAPYVGVDEGNRWGTGFMTDSPRRGMTGAGSFGHDGAGGQLGFANLEQQLSFGYQTLRPGGVPDDRAEALCRALRACL